MWSHLAHWLLVGGAGGLVIADAAAPQDGLLQYGAIGAFALLAVYAIRVMFARQVQAHERDIARADRAEQEVAALNKLIRELLVPQVTRATDVMSRMADQLHIDEHRGR